MGRPNLAECALLFAILVTGCGDGPRPRPNAWPSLGLYVEKPDLELRLAAIDREAAAAGLTLIREVETDGETNTRYVLRSYRGRDLVGRDTFACRVASPFGVVLAVGPDDGTFAAEPMFELDAGDGRLFASPGQLVAGGEPEIVLRRADGALAVWGLSPRGASPIRVALSPPPIGVRSLSSGENVLVTEVVAPPASQPLRLLIAAGYQQGGFTTKAASARRFHTESAARAREPREGEGAAARLDRLTAVAFHEVRAGGDREEIARALAREELPPELRDVQKARTAWLESR